MKKYIFSLIAIIGCMLTFTLTSCDSNDKDSPENDTTDIVNNGIVGTWVWTYSDSEGKDEVKMTFKANGKCTYYSTYIDYEDGSRENFSATGTYDYDEAAEMLYMELDFEDGWETILWNVRIRGDKLYLLDDEETIVFKRVS